jgi:hypothetical protein
MLEELQKTKHELYCEVKNAKSQLDLARQITHEKEDIYNRLKAEFMKVDLELAMIDGRFKKVEDSKKKPKQSAPKLTQEQILEIAQKLGIQVQIEED